MNNKDQKIQKQILIEDSVEAIWKYFDLSEENLKAMFPWIIALNPIKADEKRINNVYEPLVKIKGKERKAEMRITSWKDDATLKEVGVMITVKGKFEAKALFSIVPFEGKKEESLIKCTIDWKTSNPIFLINEKINHTMENNIYKTMENIKLAVEAKFDVVERIVVT